MDNVLSASCFSTGVLCFRKELIYLNKGPRVTPSLFSLFLLLSFPLVTFWKKNESLCLCENYGTMKCICVANWMRFPGIYNYLGNLKYFYVFTTWDLIVIYFYIIFREEVKNESISYFRLWESHSMWPFWYDKSFWFRHTFFPPLCFDTNYHHLVPNSCQVAQFKESNFPRCHYYSYDEFMEP